MAFDLSSARPVEDQPPSKGGFDLSSAQPVNLSKQPAASKSLPRQIGEGALGAVENVMSGITGAAAVPVAVVGGGLAPLVGIPAGQAYKGIKNALVYRPQTEAGRGAGEVINTLMLPSEVTGAVAEGLTGSPYVGQATADIANLASPFLAARYGVPAINMLRKALPWLGYAGGTGALIKEAQNALF